MINETSNKKPKSKFLEALEKEVLIFDGAFGTGFPECKDFNELNFTHPQEITAVHSGFIKAGADVILANTFSANRLKLENSSYSVEEVVLKAVENAKKASPRFVALDVGPLGKLVNQEGGVDFEDAVEIFSETITAGEKAGVDFILLETFSSLLEIKAAIIAAKENSSLPIVASLTMEENLRTVLGTDAVSAAVFFNSIGVNAFGINCSTSPFDIAPIIEDFCKLAKVPVLVMPNASLPDENGEYSVSPNDFILALEKYHSLGVSLFGGCCGTTASHIEAIKNTLKGKSVKKPTPKPFYGISANSKTVEFTSPVIIGERLNPTGKKELSQALKNQELDYIIKEAVLQEEKGASILDVNCSLAGLNEEEVLPKVISKINSVLDFVPLSIDSTSQKAIEKAARVYCGKPLINSVNGTKESMNNIFPIVKKYGGSVIALTLDENGIPKTAIERYKIAKKIIQSAKEFGIEKEDIIVDCLTLTASSSNPLETIRAIRLVKNLLKVKTVLGVSNVSFGLPAREVLNSVFLVSAFTAGLDIAIINPLCKKTIQAVSAFSVLNQNKNAIENYTKLFSAEEENEEITSDDCLSSLIFFSREQEAKNKTRELLKEYSKNEILEKYIISALMKSGELFEQNKIFLPKLLSVAGTASLCLDEMATETDKQEEKETIVLATVLGDIHDIGKNIVKLLFRSFGYRVIDLGKNVSKEEIVRAAKNENAKIVGLSALMTTTLKAMEESTKMLKEEIPNIKVIVGGAVVTEEFAKLIGADFYAKDALSGVKLVENCFYPR